jgi:hypothetical protein
MDIPHAQFLWLPCESHRSQEQEGPFSTIH